MNKLILIYSVLLISFTSCLNNDNKEERIINALFENGAIQEETIYPNGEQDSLNYILIDYNPNGSIAFKGAYKNGKKEGLFTWTYPNGNKKWIDFYKAGINADTTFCYYETGELKRKVHLPDGDNRCKAIEFYKSGKIKISSYLVESSYIDSTWLAYHENGFIKERGLIRGGRKVGFWSFYNAKGELLDSIDQTGQDKFAFDFDEIETSLND